jgi:hypothetical protein
LPFLEGGETVAVGVRVGIVGKLGIVAILALPGVRHGVAVSIEKLFARARKDEDRGAGIVSGPARGCQHQADDCHCTTDSHGIGRRSPAGCRNWTPDPAQRDKRRSYSRRW